MDAKFFKKITGDLLIRKGFLRNGNYHRLFLEDLIIVVGLQKSNHSDGYYINVGYIIKTLNPLLSNPRDVDGDIRARFSLGKDGKESDFFDLKEITDVDSEAFLQQIDQNIKRYIDPVTNLADLKSLLLKFPVMLFQTKITAKRMLGLE